MIFFFSPLHTPMLKFMVVWRLPQQLQNVYNDFHWIKTHAIRNAGLHETVWDWRAGKRWFLKIFTDQGGKATGSPSGNKARGFVMLCEDVLIETGSSAASDNLCNEDALKSLHVVANADNRASAWWSPSLLPLQCGFRPPVQVSTRWVKLRFKTHEGQQTERFHKRLLVYHSYVTAQFPTSRFLKWKH